MWCVKSTETHQGYLKFITQTFPDGLFGGIHTAQKFESMELAHRAIAKIKWAIPAHLRFNSKLWDWALGLIVVDFGQELELYEENLEASRRNSKRINVWSSEFWGGTIRAN